MYYMTDVTIAAPHGNACSSTRLDHVVLQQHGRSRLNDVVMVTVTRDTPQEVADVARDDRRPTANVSSRVHGLAFTHVWPEYAVTDNTRRRLSMQSNSNCRLTDR